MARKIISFAEANQILGPHIELYLDCIRNGFTDYKNLNEYKNTHLDDYGEFEIRTRAGIVHDRIRARLTAQFGNASSVEVGEWKQVFALKFSEDVFMRIKKFSKDGTVSSFRTKQHIRFMRQASIEGFPEEPTFIIGGYIPNKTWTDLIGIYLACYSADGLEWFNKVGEYVVEQARIIFPETTPAKKRKKFMKKSNDDKKTGTDNV